MRISEKLSLGRLNRVPGERIKTNEDEQDDDG